MCVLFFSIVFDLVAFGRTAKPNSFWTQTAGVIGIGILGIHPSSDSRIERTGERERKRERERHGRTHACPPRMIPIRGDGSTENVSVQEDCMRSAALEGLVGGLQALAVSTVGVLGACKAFPKFNRSLSVSSKTALIATPFFGTFVLLSELELNACAKRAREARLLLSQQQKARGGRR